MTFNFTILISRIFRMTEECNSDLAFLLSMTGCFKEDKDCAGHLAFLFLMTGIFKMLRSVTAIYFFYF